MAFGHKDRLRCLLSWVACVTLEKRATKKRVSIFNFGQSRSMSRYHLSSDNLSIIVARNHKHLIYYLSAQLQVIPRRYPSTKDSRGVQE